MAKRKSAIDLETIPVIEIEELGANDLNKLIALNDEPNALVPKEAPIVCLLRGIALGLFMSALAIEVGTIIYLGVLLSL